jgi:hypothetical protein
VELNLKIVVLVIAGALLFVVVRAARFAEVVVNVFRHRFGVAVAVLVLLVRAVLVHDVNGVAAGVRLDMDVRLRAALFVIFAAVHVARALWVHSESHKVS